MRKNLLISFCLLPLCALAQEVRYFDKFFIAVDKNKTNYERRYALDAANKTIHVEDYAFSLKQASGTIYGLATLEAGENFIKYASNEASRFHYKPEFENVHGEFTKYKKDGAPDVHYFVNNNRVIYGQVWDESGMPRLVNGSGKYDRNVDDGKSLSVESFVDSVLAERYKVRLAEQDTIYSKVDRPAEPKEGMEAFYSMLAKKMRYPAFAKFAGKEGVVLLYFVVDKNGNLTGFRPLTPDNSAFEKKVLQKFEGMPDWNPAVFKGKNVKVDYAIPVRFKLQ